MQNGQTLYNKTLNNMILSSLAESQLRSLGNPTVISLVTSCFNDASTLVNTLQSIQAQAAYHQPSERASFYLDYNIVDAGSRDDSLSIIAQFSSHLSSWISEPDSGLYAGLNKGFWRSHGDIMGWINSDDFLLPGALQTVAEIFQSFPSIQWITSLTQLAADSDGRICIVKSLPGICSQAIREGAFLPGIVRNAYGHIQQESTFWRRSLWDACGASLSEQHGLAGDYELWQRFAQVAEPVGLTIPLGVFRLRAGQASSGSRYRKDLQRVWEEQNLASTPQPLARLRGYLRGWPLCAQRHTLSRLLCFGLRNTHYTGQRLVRVNPQGPNSSWRLERHVFI